MTELMVAIPWWGWIGIAAAAVVLLVVAVCTVWAAIHRGVLLSRARAHASHGVRISDNEAALIICMCGRGASRCMCQQGG